MRSPRASGMTLIELLVVVAVVGILATIAFWNVSTVVPGYRLRASASDVVGMLSVTRAKAIAQNRSITVEFRAADYRIFTDADGDGLFEVGDTVLETRAYENGVTYFQPGTGLTTGNGLAVEDVVVFSSRGLATNIPPDGLDIGLTNGVTPRLIQIRYSGLARKI